MRANIESIRGDRASVSIMVKVVQPSAEYMAKMWDPKVIWILEPKDGVEKEEER